MQDERLTQALDALAGPLRVLVAVADHEHVTRAAGELGLGQPTVSRALARISAAVGVELVAPHGRGLRLTAAGRTLAEHGRRALAELDRGLEEVHAEDDPSTGRVALGFLHTLGPAAVPALVRAFRDAHPGARFSLVQGAAGTLLAQLRGGEVDLVLTSPLPEADDLVARPLLQQRLVLTVWPGHPLAGRGAVELDELREEEFVAFEPGYGLRDTTERMFAAVGFAPRTGLLGQDADTLRGLVAAGLGIAVLPPARPGAAGGVVELELGGPSTTRTLGLVHRSGPLPRAVRAFHDLVLARPELLRVRAGGTDGAVG
ncbi:LysR family transcriptional regulator [Kineococcus gynurae]|uniref:LysR family transcriptional regulator n=1 Tax=Kineococcus gynurae TaxID=452979 RepID=A0ABV5LPT4_9ACTN